MRRTVLSGTAAFVLLLGWFALVVRLGLPYTESESLVFFIALSCVVLVVLGRWLARMGSLLVVLGLLPVYAVFFGGWAGIGDEILLSRGKTVEAVVTAESVRRLKGDLVHTYDLRNPDGSAGSLDPGIGTRLAVGSRVAVVEDPDGLVATQLAGRQDPTVPLVFAGLGVAGLVIAVTVTAVVGEWRRVRNATPR